jgi:hypothetical protein
MEVRAPQSLTCTHCFALVQARLEEAKELKQEENDLFRRSKWNKALNGYPNGLARLPKRNLKTPTTSIVVIASGTASNYRRRR